MLTHLQHQRPVGRGLVDRQLEQHVHGLFVRQGGQAETPTSSLSRALAQGSNRQRHGNKSSAAVLLYQRSSSLSKD